MRVVSRVEGGGKGRAGSVAGTVAQERAVRRTGMRSSTIVGLRDSGEKGFALPEDVRHFSRGDRQTCFSVYLSLSLCSCSSDGVCSLELCSVGAVLVLRWCSVGVVLVQRWCSSPLLDVAALVQRRWCFGAALVHSRCCFGAALVQRWCSVGVVLVQRWCSVGCRPPVLQASVPTELVFSSSAAFTRLPSCRPPVLL